MCSPAVRMRVEADIMKRTVEALLLAGHTLSVIDYGDGPEAPTGPIGTAAEIMDLLHLSDDERVYWRRPDDLGLSWVYFVYGNDGWDVLADYTTDLEKVLAPVNAYADTLS